MAETDVINLIVNVVQRGGRQLGQLVRDLGNVENALERATKRQQEHANAINRDTDTIDEYNRRLAAHEGQLKRIENQTGRWVDEQARNNRIIHDSNSTLAQRNAAMQRNTQIMNMQDRAIRDHNKIFNDTIDLERTHQRVIRDNIVHVEDNTRVHGRLSNTLGSLRNAWRTNDYDANRFTRTLGFLRGEAHDASRWSRNLEIRLGRLGRTFLGLIIGSVLIFLQSFASAISGLIGSVVALAGSLVYAAGALGGVFVASLAQAIPIIGLAAATMSRLNLIGQHIQQTNLVNKQGFRDTTGAINEQAGAADSLRNAQEGLIDAQRGLTEARREAKRELQDLIIEERRAILGARDTQAALSDALQSGDIGAVQSAELDVVEANLRAKRSRQDLGIARRGGPGSPQDRVIQAQRQLADANRAVAAAHRQASNAADTQSAAQGNLAFVTAQLSAAELRLAKTIEHLRDTAKKVLTPITDQIINSFTFAVKRVEGLVTNPRLLGAFDGLAAGVAHAIRRMTRDLTSNKSLDFFVRMTKEATRNLKPLERIAHNIFVVFRNIATAAAPVLHKMLKLIADETGRWAKASKDTKGMTEFFFEGLRMLRAWWGLLKATVRLLLTLFGISNKSAVGTIKDLTHTINQARKSLEADPSGAASFFEKSAETVSYLGEILLSLARAFIKAFDPKTVKALGIIIDNVLVPAITNTVIIMGRIANVLGDVFSNKTVRKVAVFAATFVLVKGSIGILMTVLLPFGSIIKSIMFDLPIFVAGLFGIGPASAGSAGGVAALQAALAPLGLSIGALALIIVGIIAFVVLFRKEILAAFKDSGLSDAVGEFLGQFEDLFKNLNNLFGPDGKFSFIFKGIKYIVGKALKVAFVPFTVFIDSISGFIKILNGIMEGDFGKIWDGIKQIISAPFKGALKILGTLTEPFRDIGKAIAHALRVPFETVFDIVKGILDKMLGLVSTVLHQIGSIISSAPTVDLPGFDPIDLGAPGDAINKSADAIDKFRENLRGEKDDAQKSTKAHKDLEKSIADTVPTYKQARRVAADLHDETNKGSKRNLEFRDTLKILIRKFGDTDDGSRKTRRGLKALASNFINAGGTAKGLADLIKGLTNKALKAFGVPPLTYSVGDINHYFKQQAQGQVPDLIQGYPTNQIGGILGGWGQRGPDDRLIAVAGGEAVLTGFHQQPVNLAMAYAQRAGLIPYRNLRDLFSGDRRRHKDAPRGFASGGMVDIRADPGGELINPAIANIVSQWIRRYHADITAGYDPGGGHVSPGHNVSGTATDVVPIGGWGGRATALFEKGLATLVQAGFEVGYDGRAGTFAWPNHGRGNHAHIEWYGNGSAVNAIQRLLNMGFVGGLALGTKIPQVKIKGPDTKLKELLQGQADKLRTSANKLIAKKAKKAGGFGFEGAETSGSGRDLFMQISKQRGWNFADWWEIDRRETNHGQDLLNEGSGAALRGQFMPNLTQGKYGPGSAPWMHPSMAQQIVSMARYIADRYGNPTRALAHHNAYNWYGRGGLIPSFDGGGVVPGPLGMPTLVEAHGGETFLPTHKFAYQTGGTIANPQRVLRESMKLLEKTSRNIGRIKNFEKLLNALNELTREGGAFDDIAESIDAISTIMQTKLTMWALKLRHGIVSQVVTNVQKADKAVAQLAKIGDDLADEFKDVTKIINNVKKRIKRLKGKKGKKDERQKLQVALEGLQSKQNDIEAALAENMQNRLDAQNEAWDAVVSEFEQRLSKNETLASIADLQRQLSGALPDPSADAARIQQRINILQEERGAIESQLVQAQQTGNIELQRELEQMLLENQQSLLEAQLDIVNAYRDAWHAQLEEFNRRIGDIDIQKSIVDLLNQISDTVNPQQTESLIRQRIQILEQEREAMQQALAEAQARGDTVLANELQTALLQNQADLLQAQLDIIQTYRDAWQKTLDEFNRRLSNLDIIRAIADLRNQLVDAIDPAQTVSFIRQRIAILQEEKQAIEKALADAQARGDTVLANQLETALLENEQALLQAQLDILQAYRDAWQKALDEFQRRLSDLDIIVGIHSLMTQLADIIDPGAMQGYIQQRIQILEQQRQAILQALADAQARGDIVLTTQLQTALLENQQALLQAQVDTIQVYRDAWQQTLERFTRRLSILEITNTIQGLILQLADALPDPSAMEAIIKQRMEILNEQREAMYQELADAQARKDYQLINEIEQALLENQQALLEAQIAILDAYRTAWQAELDKFVQRLGILDLQVAIANLLNQIYDMLPSSDTIRQQLQDRANILGQERERMQAALAAAQERGDEEMIRTLEQQLLENQQSLLEIQTAWMQAAKDSFDAIMGRFTQQIGDLDIMKSILDLQGQLSGTPDVAAMQANLEQRGAILEKEREAIQTALDKAIAEGDAAFARELRTALLSNEQATLENTVALKELEGTLAQAFGFNTTAWTLFRRAVLNGMGGLLPEYAALIPQAQTGGLVTKEGIMSLHAGELITPLNQGVLGTQLGLLLGGKKYGIAGNQPTTQNMEFQFTQPMEVADPTALSSAIAWKLKTFKA